MIDYTTSNGGISNMIKHVHKMAPKLKIAKSTNMLLYEVFKFTIDGFIVEEVSILK